jgi:SAM-dependent methyltransferase
VTENSQQPIIKDPDEQSLSMPREKKRSVLISLGYRFGRFGDAIFGKRRMLRLFLKGSWLFWRFAFERSGQIYDDDFHNQSKALSEEYLQRWIAPNDTVIDIGCGLGRWCEIAAKYAGSVVGIDYSDELIAEARHRASAPNVEYIKGDLTRDLDGRRFDLALMTHVIEHIDDPDTILRELRAVTRRLIVEVPDLESDPLNFVRLAEGCPFYSDGDHVREYTQAILNAQLERNGWTVLENRKSGGAVLAVAELAPA